MKILSIAGARPNFMKIAPLHRAFQANPSIESKIIHTGQHYDRGMSDIFFQQLELPEPDYNLGVGGGSHTQQTAKIMLEFEKVVELEKPDLVVVVGDVNSTVACTLVSSKMGIRVAHVEAGLRSFDRAMPEEINRLLTDSISDYLFVSEMAGMINLAKEGVASEKTFFVGNVMIDSLVHFREKAKALDVLASIGVAAKDYVLVTMHRPSNVDNAAGLSDITAIIEDLVQHRKVVFPVHPRTEKNLAQFGLLDKLKSLENLVILPPQGYLEFLNLMDNACLVLTDSGGIQEETTYLQVPCLTFRNSTERPVTVELGTNQLLADLNPATVKAKVGEIFAGKAKAGVIPPFWDGKAALRIADILLEKYAS
ncbi:MAG: UDP-N-acetylglucosamine 2-epimerase (non-hydrolyzing) [Saprospiraceae bacterium]|nr:UDP-N-acetylglucosamine 2-epimerase (non-hydrolyzing) [Saprospiraceae bacterium]